MKHLRKLTSVLAVLCLLLTLWIPTAVVAEAVPAESAQAQSGSVRATDNILYATGELLAALDNGEALQYFYNAIIDGIIEEKSHINVDYNGYTLGQYDAAIIESAVNATIPEGYGASIGHSYGGISTYDTYLSYFTYFHTWELTQGMEDQTNARVDELTADLVDKSDYDKSRILYERLVEENTYDFGNYDQTAYSALVEGASVCAGYGRSYQLMLQELGIPCLYIYGDADNGYMIGGHAWNLVRLDGKWYYSDPTWDDYDNPDYPLAYNYFNITYDQISTDHFLDGIFELWVPTEPAYDANYYYREGMVYQDTITYQELAELLKHQSPLTLYVIGDRDKVYNLFWDNIGAIVNATGHDYYYGASASWSGAQNLTLTLELPHTYGGDWWQDDTHHAHLCTECGGRSDYDEHTYDGDTCTTCGYTKSVTALPGDANGDGKVNNRDLGLLQRYLNGYENITIDVAAADLSGDGKVNNRDLGLLQRLLNA